MIGWGGLFNGPLGHVFYEQLDRVVSLGGARGVALKIAIDQLLFTPPLTFGFFAWQHLLSAAEPSAFGAAEFASNNLWPTLRINWVYWSLVHTITFACVPLQYRVAFVALKNFFWGGYLSWAARSECAEEQHDDRLSRAQRLARTYTH